MATTPSGWDYVQSADDVVDFPTSSEALATKLEARGVAPASTLYLFQNYV